MPQTYTQTEPTNAIDTAGNAPVVQTTALPPQNPPDPIAGGNYLRDPVTGELSLNPAHPVSNTPQE